MKSGQQFTVQSFTNNGTLAVAAGATGTITGDFAQDAAATFQTNVSDDTNYGKLVVIGTATLPADAKIHVNVANPAYSFSSTGMSGIISATHLSASTFITTDNSTLFNFTAVKNGDAVDLTLAAASVEPTEPTPPTATPTYTLVEQIVSNAGNTSARGAAHVLGQIFASNPSGPVSGLFVPLSSDADVNNAATQTLPLLSGGTTLAASSAMGGINRIVQARIDANRGLSSGDVFLGDKNVWMKPFGSRADQDERNGVAGYEAKTYGLAIGGDATVSPALRLGAAFAYARSDINGQSTVAPQSADVDVYQLIGYGSYSLNDRTELNFQADVGQNRNAGRRQIAFASTVASSDYDSQTAHLGLGIGRVYPLNPRTSLTPSVRADYTWIKDEAYSETGAGALNLNVNSRTTEALVLGVDGKLAHQLNDQTSLTANLGVGYDTLNEQASITAAFAGAPGTAFVTYGVDPSPWLVRGGLGAVYKTRNGVEITARYDAEYRADFLNQTASVKARWTF